MTKLTDETLIFYVDGALDPAERTRVETLLASDTEACARVHILRTVGRELAELMRRRVEVSVPPRPPGRIVPPQNGLAPAARGQRERRSAWFKKWQ